MGGMKVAIFGAHGSGKTTLAHQVVAALKKQNHMASLCTDVARESHYISSRTHAPEVQLDLFGRQIAAEAEAVRTNEIVVCDRTLLDRAVYAWLFFEPDLTPAQRELFEAMDNFVTVYMKSYRLLFRAVTTYTPAATRDAARPTDPSLQESFNHRLLSRLQSIGVQYTDLQMNEAVEHVVSRIVETLKDDAKC